MGRGDKLDHAYTPDSDYNTRDVGTGGDGDTDVSDTVAFLFALLFLCVACFAFQSGVPRLLLMSSIYAATMLGFMVSNHI